MTTPISANRSSDIRKQSQDPFHYAYSTAILDVTECLAEIDRLSNDYAALVKFNNAQIDLTHKHIKQIADLHAENKSFRAVLEAHEDVKAKLQAQLKSARDRMLMAINSNNGERKYLLQEWLKENPA